MTYYYETRTFRDLRVHETAELHDPAGLAVRITRVSDDVLAVTVRVEGPPPVRRKVRLLDRLRLGRLAPAHTKGTP